MKTKIITRVFRPHADRYFRDREFFVSGRRGSRVFVCGDTLGYWVREFNRGHCGRIRGVRVRISLKRQRRWKRCALRGYYICANTYARSFIKTTLLKKVTTRLRELLGKSYQDGDNFWMKLEVIK